MQIAIIASDMKKELMTQFCIAYCGVLSKHHLCATSITAKYIAEATGLKIEKLSLDGGELVVEGSGSGTFQQADPIRRKIGRALMNF